MQSRLHSLIEAWLNTLSGFAVALVLQLLVNHWYGLGLKVSESLHITLIFTVVSVVRSYAWRRYFNRRLHREYQKTQAHPHWEGKEG